MRSLHSCLLSEVIIRFFRLLFRLTAVWTITYLLFISGRDISYLLLLTFKRSLILSPFRCLRSSSTVQRPHWESFIYRLWCANIWKKKIIAYQPPFVSYVKHETAGDRFTLNVISFHFIFDLLKSKLKWSAQCNVTEHVIQLNVIVSILDFESLFCSLRNWHLTFVHSRVCLICVKSMCVRTQCIDIFCFSFRCVRSFRLQLQKLITQFTHENKKTSIFLPIHSVWMEWTL